MTQAADGNTVKVHYRGTLDSGEQFDSSEGRDPLQFTLGQRQVIAGFEKAVLGLTVGESRKVRMEAEEAYGPRRDDLIHKVERARIPAEVEIMNGMQLGASGPNGEQLSFTVVDFNDEEVTLDANHRLAGEALTFEVELVEIA